MTGTCFRVTVQGPSGEPTYVHVLEGSVEVRNGAGKAALLAGEWGRLVAGRAPERVTHAPSLPLALDQLFARAQGSAAAPVPGGRAQLADASGEWGGDVSVTEIDLCQLDLGLGLVTCAPPFLDVGGRGRVLFD